LIYHWSSEIYGLGRAYRTAYNIPRGIPLPFFSDHGVIPSGVIDEEILNLPLRKKTLLTFSKSIAIQQGSIFNLRVLGQIHPWILYKEKKGIRRLDSASTVIFFPLHTVEGYNVMGMDDEASVDLLSELGEPKPNIRVCLHWNDLNTPREEFFKVQGFQIISFGNPMSDMFIENFYKYAQNAKYAISESWTSGIAFLIDLGIPCQIIPRDVQIASLNALNQNVGFSNPEVKKDINQAEDLFSQLFAEVSVQQQRFVQEHLGFEFRTEYKANRRAIISLYLTSLPSWIVYQCLRRFHR
jgi:hypothetical protein